MNWKTDMRLADMQATAMLEGRCLKCGKVKVRRVDQLQVKYAALYVDELERRLVCADRWCRGRLKLSLLHQHKVSGFVGGLA